MKLLVNAWLERRNPLIEICNLDGQSLFTLDATQINHLFDSGDICLTELSNSNVCDLSFSELLSLYFSSLSLNNHTNQ